MRVILKEDYLKIPDDGKCHFLLFSCPDQEPPLELGLDDKMY